VPNGDVIFEALCSADDVALGVAGCATTESFSSANVAAAAFASEMDDYIRQQGLEHWRGRIMPRNSHRSPWATVLDLRVSQELPVFRKTRGVLTVDIENFANLLNNDWGQLRQVNFPYVAPVVDVKSHRNAGLPERRGELLRLPPAVGRDGTGQAIRDHRFVASVWRIQLGFRLEF
jgi:hypothetical protein